MNEDKKQSDDSLYESGSGSVGNDHKAPILALSQEKDPQGRFAFLAFVFSLLFDVERDYQLHITIADLSAQLMKLDPLNMANIYRKEHGNIAQLLHRFDFDCK